MWGAQSPLVRAVLQISSRAHFVKAWVEGIEVAAVQVILQISQGFTEPLEVDDLTFPQEADRVAYIRVFYKPKDVVVCGSGFLFGSHVFEKVGDRVAFRLELGGAVWHAACGLGPDAHGVIDIVRRESLCLQFLRRQVSCQLVDDGCDHFHVGKFLGADVGEHCLLHPVRHHIALGQVAEGGADFAVGAPLL